MESLDLERMMIKSDKLTKTMFLEQNHWKKATLLYEKAANGFMLARKYENAKIAFEKASKGQEILLSPLRAAKHMESAAAAAKELGIWIEVSKFHTKAAVFYKECGRTDHAYHTLWEGAIPLEDAWPDEAIKLYRGALSILKLDNWKGSAFNIFYNIVHIYLNNQKYREAIATLRELVSAAAESDNDTAQVEAYIGLIIIYLYVDDFKHGEDLKHAKTCYHIISENECLVDHFRCTWASSLLSFYEVGDYDKMKHLLAWNPHPKHWIVSLADEIALKTDATKVRGELLDENDNHDCNKTSPQS